MPVSIESAPRRPRRKVEGLAHPDTVEIVSPSQTTTFDDTPPLEKKPNTSVLLVDDSLESCLILREYLRQSPFEVDEAPNGVIAVAKVKIRRYDFIVMDLLMPEMDGFEAMRTIRKWEEEQGYERACIIIALSAWELKEAVPESFECGADAHLTKPIGRAKLLAMLSENWARAGT